MTVKCTKEKELAELHTDMKWIKKTLENITPKISNIHDTFNTGEGKINVLNKEVFGNGKKGLREEITLLRIQIAVFSGAIALIAFVAPYLLKRFT